MLMRMLNCPARSPFRASRRLLGKRPQILKTRRGVQNFETLVGLSVETLKLPDKFTARKSFGSFVAVAQNHAISYKWL